MGLYCSVFVMCSVVLAKQLDGRRSVFMAVMGVIGMGLLLLTKSRGSLVGLGAALVVVFALRVSPRTRLLALTAMVTVICGAIISIPDLSSHAQTWARLGRTDTFDLASMTGRMELFQYLLTYVADRPLLGYGYGSFWQPVRILEVARSQGWIVGSSHNQLIGMLLDLGLAGGTVFLVLLGSSLRVSIVRFQRDRSALSLFPVAVLVWSCINMITFGFWFETTIPSLLALLVVAHLAIRDSAGSVSPRGEWVSPARRVSLVTTPPSPLPARAQARGTAPGGGG